MSWLLYLVLVGATNAGYYDEFTSFDECLAAAVETLDGEGAAAVLCEPCPSCVAEEP